MSVVKFNKQIRFLNIVEHNADEIHCQFWVKYFVSIKINEGNLRQGVVSLRKAIKIFMMKKRVAGLEFGLIMDWATEQVSTKVKENHCCMISDLFIEFPEVSKTTLFAIMSNTLGIINCALGFINCARWGPKILASASNVHKLISACAFLFWCHRKGDILFLHIITGNGTWISYVYVNIQATESEQQYWSHAQWIPSLLTPQELVCVSTIQGNVRVENLCAKLAAEFNA